MSQGRIKQSGIPVIIMLALLFCMAVAWIAYSRYGHEIVRAMYEGRSVGILNQVIGSQDIHPLEFYLRKADMIFYQMLFFAPYFFFSFLCISFFKKTDRRIEALVILLAFAVAIHSHFPALVNRYVINDDVRQHTWWMGQFHDRELFRNDLLAEYARNLQPWGFFSLYYVLSFLMDPLVIGKVLPLVLFAVASFYIFRVVKHVAGSNYAGFLGALLFIITPTYLRTMAGGHSRAFAYPLIIVFLYYLIRRKYMAASAVLVLQCLFYPMVFLLGALTYSFTFISIRHKRLLFDRSVPKIKFFILAVVVCAVVLYGKYFLGYNPSIGRPVTRGEMAGKTEFYDGNRWPVLPTPPLHEEILRNVERAIVVPAMAGKFPGFIREKPVLFRRAVFLGAGFFLAAGLFVFRRRLSFAPEILFLFLAGVLMYKIADLFMLRLYSPRRYLLYSVPLVILMTFAIVIGRAIMNIKRAGVRRAFQIAVVVLALTGFDVNRNNALIDMSSNKELYEYLSGLPKDTMIAAHPVLADGIPTFAQRKVFIKLELSVPLFDRYWEEIKKRTFDFFDAYYAEDPLSVYEFCEKNGIDYLVVDERHFTDEYLARGGIYFEPFNTYVSGIVRKRKNFALENIPETDKLFVRGSLFVIGRDALRH